MFRCPCSCSFSGVHVQVFMFRCSYSSSFSSVHVQVFIFRVFIFRGSCLGVKLFKCFVVQVFNYSGVLMFRCSCVLVFNVTCEKAPEIQEIQGEAEQTLIQHFHPSNLY